MAAERLRRRTEDTRGERIRRGIRTFCITFAVVVASFAAIRAEKATSDLQTSRSTTRTVLCAANAAVIDAGRAIITGAQPKPGSPLTKLEISLQRLGYPPRPQRRKAAEAAAEAYSRKIAQTIEQQTHVRGVVKRNGALDCKRLNELAEKR